MNSLKILDLLLFLFNIIDWNLSRWAHPNTDKTTTINTEIMMNEQIWIIREESLTLTPVGWISSDTDCPEQSKVAEVHNKKICYLPNYLKPTIAFSAVMSVKTADCYRICAFSLLFRTNWDFSRVKKWQTSYMYFMAQFKRDPYQLTTIHHFFEIRSMVVDHKGVQVIFYSLTITL